MKKYCDLKGKWINTLGTGVKAVKNFIALLSKKTFSGKKQVKECWILRHKQMCRFEIDAKQ